MAGSGRPPAKEQGAESEKRLERLFAEPADPFERIDAQKPPGCLVGEKRVPGKPRGFRGAPCVPAWGRPRARTRIGPAARGRSARAVRGNLALHDRPGPESPAGWEQASILPTMRQGGRSAASGPPSGRRIVHGQRKAPAARSGSCRAPASSLARQSVSKSFVAASLSIRPARHAFRGGSRMRAQRRCLRPAPRRPPHFEQRRKWVPHRPQLHLAEGRVHPRHPSAGELGGQARPPPLGAVAHHREIQEYLARKAPSSAYIPRSQSSRQLRMNWRPERCSRKIAKAPASLGRAAPRRGTSARASSRPPSSRRTPRRSAPSRGPPRSGCCTAPARAPRRSCWSRRRRPRSRVRRR